MGQALSGMTSTQPAAAQQPSGATPTIIPAVMTPAEAAVILRVSEEDVIAAITAGELKARKLGSAYRISKEALETFLNG
jgi:excisionase family DNA binding protein